MKWEKVKLGDIATFSNGINFNKTAYAKGIKLIGVSNFGDRFYPDYSQLQEVKKDIVRLEDCLRNGDIVFVRSNGNKELVGRCMLVKNPTERVTYSGFCIRARLNDTDRYDPVYFTYYFKSKAFRRAVSGTAVGANIQNLSQARLSNHECRIPSIEVQHRIADILSAYDDLIENNQKQIKLLEEAAQRLYKEWFVDLNFPGHENTKIVDGVPEGWSIYPFSSKVDIMSGGTPKTSIPDYYNGKIPFYTPKDNDGAFFAYKTQMNITEGGLKNCNSRLYPPKTVIITARGTVGKTTILAVPMAMNQSCYALKMKENDAPYYLFFALNNEIKALQTMANGGVFNTIIGKTFDSINIQIPKDPLIYGFEETVRPFMEQIKNKLQANLKLVEARDRLLPKLMNGEVEA